MENKPIASIQYLLDVSQGSFPGVFFYPKNLKLESVRLLIAGLETTPTLRFNLGIFQDRSYFTIEDSDKITEGDYVEAVFTKLLSDSELPRGLKKKPKILIEFKEELL